MENIPAGTYTPTPSKINTFKNSEDLYTWLGTWPSILAQLKLIVISLKRRQLEGAHTCAKATIEILRSLLGRCLYIYVLYLCIRMYIIIIIHSLYVYLYYSYMCL